ncbi:hypothetical protein ACLE20_00720 [Rhizobium sp. YIM 134829]|uniref:hypothetical protein n=1 Tax=Rhizobium sp. YIM 134829 TaxID=3390453 RepID=UPI003977F4C3
MLSTNRKLVASIMAEFGEGPNGGGLWLPDHVVRSAAIGDNGRAYFTGRESFVAAGSGDDWINAGADSMIDGGKGNDSINMIDGGEAYGGQGDDGLTGSYAQLHGGVGDDGIDVLTGSEGYGDEGRDHIRAILGGVGFGGTGADVLTALYGGTIHGGEQDDVLSAVGRKNTLSGDEGDDSIDLTQAIDSVVTYGRGDGHDTIVVGSGYKEFGETQHGSNTLALWNIRSTDATIEQNGDEAIIRFKGTDADSIKITFTDDTALAITFRDGTSQILSRQHQSGLVAQVNAAYQGV